MNLTAYIDYLVAWLEDQRRDLYHLDGYTLGVSGGVDSAVCAHLVARTGRPVHALMLPAAVSSEADLQDAEAVLQSAGLTGSVISIAPLYDLAMQQLAPVLNPEPERLNVLRGNLMARLRMVLLYTTAPSSSAPTTPPKCTPATSPNTATAPPTCCRSPRCAKNKFTKWRACSACRRRC